MAPLRYQGPWMSSPPYRCQEGASSHTAAYQRALPCEIQMVLISMLAPTKQLLAGRAEDVDPALLQ